MGLPPSPLNRWCLLGKDSAFLPEKCRPKQGGNGLLLALGHFLNVPQGKRSHPSPPLTELFRTPLPETSAGTLRKLTVGIPTDWF